MKKDFEAFLKSKAITPYSVYHYGVPCYSVFVNTQSSLVTEEDIKKYIDFSLDSCNENIVKYSVTERDLNYKLWFKVLNNKPNGFCFPVRSIHAGKYNCWFFVFKSKGALKHNNLVSPL